MLEYSDNEVSGFLQNGEFNYLTKGFQVYLQFDEEQKRSLGDKQFELTNHLGNVLATISDRKGGSTDVSFSPAIKYDPAIISAQDYYPFGMTMPKRSVLTDMYRFGFNGQEKDDEWTGSTGSHLDFGDRIYDSRLGRLLSIDPLVSEFPHISPYVFVENDPIFFIEIAGNFKLEYDEKLLRENGLTKQDLVRFEKIVNNIEKLIKDNPHALEVISNSTGFSQEQILQDFKQNEGPSITIDNVASLAEGNENGIKFDYAVVKQLSMISADNKKELSEQTLGAAMAIVHEYTHFGDATNNDGKLTGDFTWEEDWSRNLSNITKGEQNWPYSLTGHRGSDTPRFGFGVDVTITNEAKFHFQRCRPTREGLYIGVEAPQSLPKNLQGEKILETLDVQ